MYGGGSQDDDDLIKLQNLKLEKERNEKIALKEALDLKLANKHENKEKYEMLLAENELA